MSIWKRAWAVILSFLMNFFFWLPIGYNIENVPEKPDGSVRVVSFNVRCADDTFGSVNVRSRFFIAMMEKYLPDSFGVQEATAKWMKILQKRLGDKYACVTQMRDETDGAEASAVFYLKDKYELTDSGTIWLSDTPDEPYTKYEDSGCVRIATWATLKNKASGKIYTHINTHLDHVSDEARVLQVKALNKKITELQKNGQPIICTGDFNADEKSVVYDEMVTLLQDSKYLAENSDSGITYHDYGKYTEGEPIDFIFLPEGTEVERYKIIDEMVSGMFVSDHYGISVDFYI
ncbi:MAG: endonuclease/exonuclease/phosphatase family protein [Clostridia bacterium]|nr:endonuclease/exonuclease/phosphatase family protein [Clostridia bacterium]